MTSSVVLFLGADPTGGTFSIDEEFQLVEAELMRSGRDEFEIASDLDVQPREIQRLLNQYKPRLLHFSGHVTEDAELLLVDAAGKGQVVSSSVVARIFGGTGRQMRCIVLNACNGDALAPTLQDVAEVVIAMKGMVTVRAAQAFSVRFYEALACGHSVSQAFNQGIVESELAGFSGELAACMLEREPGAADGMVFAAARESSPRERTRTPTRAVASSRGRIFISYSHKDADWMARLSTMLKPLERSIGVEAWDDRRIEASANWKDEINEALARARVAVLLVSPDFLASDFIHRNELPLVLDARKRGDLDILWCYLAPCLIDETELSEIQAAHDPLMALVLMSKGEQDVALLQVAAKVGEIFRR